MIARAGLSPRWTRSIENPDLTIEGKAKERTRLAEKALAEFDKSEALEKARASVSYMQARWAAKVDEIIAPATDLHGVTLHSQIRDRVAGMSREDRFKFLQQHGDDVLVASALLTAPSWISNLSESELALIRSKLEKAALTPEVLEAKTQTAKALVACEKGWSNAIRIVADRGKIAPAKAG